MICANERCSSIPGGLLLGFCEVFPSPDTNQLSELAAEVGICNYNDARDPTFLSILSAHSNTILLIERKSEPICGVSAIFKRRDVFW